MKKIVCYVPLEKGLKLMDETWGLAKKAWDWAKIQSTPTVGVVIHAGLGMEEITSLPFDEIYHCSIDSAQWLTASSHLQVVTGWMEVCEPTESIFLFVGNPLYHEIAVRLATRHKGALATNVLEISHEDNEKMRPVLRRGVYSQKLHELICLEENGGKFITLDKSALISERQKVMPKIVMEIGGEKPRLCPIRFESQRKLGWEELTLTEARCVIGIGRGVHGGDSLNEIYELAALLNAPVGGSKVADELGLIAPERRIGASGVTLDEADIYVAIGISGSSQHLEGIKGVKHVIAINIDPAAAIFARSDVGIIGDYKEVLPGLIEALNAERRSKTC